LNRKDVKNAAILFVTVSPCHPVTRSKSALLHRGPGAFDKALDATLELAAREEDFALAGDAAHADLGTKPKDTPAIAATGMRLAHLNEIIEIDENGWRHVGRSQNSGVRIQKFAI
jgi:hypothetical protein